MTSNKQVSPVIRISQGERDASARATHLEAATRKFLVTTNERKQMSTTTNFKRIALVAVAALGLGVLSVVPSSAAVSNVVTTVTNGAATLRAGSDTLVDVDTGTATGATINVSALVTLATDSITVGFYNKSSGSATGNARLAFIETTTSSVSRVSDAGLATHADAVSVATADFDSTTAGAAAYFSMNSSSGTGNIGAKFALILDTATATAGAGTHTWTVVVTTRTMASGSLAITEYSTDVSIVVSAPSSLPSAATTTFYMGAAGSGEITVEAAVTPKVATASTDAASFTLYNKTSTGADALDTVTVTVTGVGVITDGTSTGRSIEKAQTGRGTNWTLKADGNAGLSTVTFKTSRTGLTFTRTVTFYSAKAATITAANMAPVLAIGPNTYAIAVTAKDALGTAWTGTLRYYASSAADALIAGTQTPTACNPYDADTGLIVCSITGKLIGTAKFKIIDAATVATANATSNEVTVTVKAATPASVKIAFNKATYAPGEKALVTVTPVAADGTNLPATTVTDALAAGGITSSVQLGSGSQAMDSRTITTSAYSSAASNLVAGGMTYVVYMPVVGGTVKLTATGSTGLPLAGQVDVSATATVTDNAAAALAAVTALATTVASLRTLITTLTNLVLKIQKKVKA